jgi:hypothetical protein
VIDSNSYNHEFNSQLRELNVISSPRNSRLEYKGKYIKKKKKTINIEALFFKRTIDFTCKIRIRVNRRLLSFKRNCD